MRARSSSEPIFIVLSEYIIHQKKLNARKLKEYQKQLQRKQQELDELTAQDEQKKLNKFLEKEATYSVNQAVRNLAASKEQDILLPSFTTTTPKTSSTRTTASATNAEDDEERDLQTPASTARNASALNNMDGQKAKQLPSFWVPALTPAARKMDVKKPDQHVYCPISGKPISMKDVLDVKFKLANNVDANKPLVAVRDRYVCAVTGDLLGNSVPCAVLRTSGSVVTMDCVNRLIKLDMVDPINGKTLKDDDIIPMQRGGTGKIVEFYPSLLLKLPSFILGYSGSGVQLDAKLPKPAMQ